MPSFRLSINGTYQQIIEFEPPAGWRLYSKNDSGNIFTIKTMQKDFTIIDVQFKESGKELDWKNIIPIKFSLSLLDTAKPKKEPEQPKKTSANAKPGAEPPSKATGIMIYKLKISYIPSSKTDISGDFVIKTNLKENPEKKISGTLEGKKE